MPKCLGSRIVARHQNQCSLQSKFPKTAETLVNELASDALLLVLGFDCQMLDSTSPPILPAKRNANNPVRCLSNPA